MRIKGIEGLSLIEVNMELLSLIAGWWGFPWGPIYTITSTVKNLSGGTNVTQSVIASLNSANS